MSNNYSEKSILEEIKELVEKNSGAIQEMQKQMKFVYRYIFWQRIWMIVRVVFIVILIAVGLIYLPPLIQSAIAPYQNLLQELGGQQKELFENIKKLPGAGILFNQESGNVK